MPNELTNPNNVVTEERLAQFYQQILPYLGGMPDILANKFSKADLYSTDEKMIGRWIDGKPLYQKVINISFASVITDSWVTITNIASLNIDKLAFAMAQGHNSDGSTAIFAALYQVKANGDLQIYTGKWYYMSGDSITIQYTKTTDSAVEIGDDTDYSTTEKIVGTWIDGKPIWQKTFTDLSVIIDGNSWGTVSGINTTNMSKIIDCKVYSNGDIRYYASNTYKTSNVLQLFNNRGSNLSIDAVTIQYTKTSS